MDANTQAVIGTLTAQRNTALDSIAQQNGFIADLQAKIAELESEVAKLKTSGESSASGAHARVEDAPQPQ